MIDEITNKIHLPGEERTAAHPEVHHEVHANQVLVFVSVAADLHLELSLIPR